VLMTETGGIRIEDGLEEESVFWNTRTRRNTNAPIEATMVALKSLSNLCIPMRTCLQHRGLCNVPIVTCAPTCNHTETLKDARRNDSSENISGAGLVESVSVLEDFSILQGVSARMSESVYPGRLLSDIQRKLESLKQIKSIFLDELERVRAEERVLADQLSLEQNQTGTVLSQTSLWTMESHGNDPISMSENLLSYIEELERQS